MSLINIQRIDEYNAVAYATSYINPLSNLSETSNELSNKIDGSCNILFDLLLSNGNSYNRFVYCKFDGNTIMRETIDIIDKNEMKHIYEIEIARHYSNFSEINYSNSVLSKHDIGQLFFGD